MDCKKTPLVMLDRMVAGRVYKVEEGEAEFIYSFLDTDCDRRRDETYVKKPTANSADPEDFEVQRLPKFNWKPHVFAELQFTAIRGRHGTIPIRVLNPYSAMYRKRGENGALVYFHGGGHCTGGVGDLEKGLRLLAHASSCQVYAVEYRSAPEFRDPVQLDECSAVIDWVQGEGGRERGVHPDRVAVGGDCAGANLTAAICLRRLCQRAKPPVAAQVLLYPATGLPSDAPAAASGRDLQCKGVTEFANYYFPRPKGSAPHGCDENVSAGLQRRVDLSELPPAVVCTSGVGPLRDADSQYVNRLYAAGQRFYAWHRSTKVLHGWMQLMEWYNQSWKAVDQVGQDVKMLLYGERPDDEARRVEELYG